MRKISVVGMTLFLVGISLAEIRQVPQIYQTITSAVNASQPGDTVLVSPGLYSEQVILTNRTLTLAGHYLLTGDSTLRDQTFLSLPDSLLDSLQDSRSVIRIQSNSQIRLCGFTIRGGFGTRYSTTRNRYGGGVFTDSSRIVMEWCRITHCEAQYGGGVAGYRTNSVLEHCQIDSCVGVGGMGGGAYLYLGDTIRVLNTVFLENQHSWLGGGMGGRSVECGEIVNSLFQSNTAGSQAGAAFLMGFHIERSRIIGNKADDVGGLLLQGNRRDEMYRFYENQILFNETERFGTDPAVAGGVYFDMLTDPDSAGYLVRDNDFEWNHSRSCGGVASIQCGRHFFSNNRFKFNSANASSVLEVRNSAVAYFDSNQVHDNTGAVAIRVYNGGAVRATNCEFEGNSALTMTLGYLSDELVTARDCWWGNPTGPSCAENPDGMGDSIGTGIPFMPWRMIPVFNTAIASPAFTSPPHDQSRLTIFPNPSNGAVTIRLSLPHPSHETAIQIWDRTGRKVTELHRGSLTGTITEWKYRNDRLASGKYFIMVASTEIPGSYLVPFTLIK